MSSPMPPQSADSANYEVPCEFTVDGRHEPNVVMKDNDLKHKLRFHRTVARNLFDQLFSDSEFLLKMKVMDYSLLIGVNNYDYDAKDLDEVSSRNRSRSSGTSTSGSLEENDRRRVPVSKVNGPNAYYFGIVDFQQQYNIWKKIERFLKVSFLGADSSGLSCVEPSHYRARFMQKIGELLYDSCDHDGRRINSLVRDSSIVPVEESAELSRLRRVDA